MVGYYFRLSFIVIISLLLVSGGIYLFHMLRLSRKFHSFQWLWGSTVYVFVFLSAILITYYSEVQHSDKWYGHHLSSDALLRVSITEPPIEKNKSYRYTAQVESIVGVENRLNGKLIVYVDKQVQDLPSLGDVLYLKNTLQRIPGANSPGAFDYGLYMSRKGYYHSAWLREGDFFISSKRVRNANYGLYQCRNGVLNVLSAHFKDPKILGVAEALLIGYKEHLDPELKTAFTDAGVIHVIAISGLHLGLIYVVLVFLLKKVRWVWKKLLLRTLLVLGAMWIFSLLTGAPASVLRSAVMFSCMHIGEGFFRKSSVYNSMAASAFVLLCYNPFFLWDPGFLLSYLAVLGIVSLQRPLFTSLYFKWKPLRMIWGLVVVSLSAQLATLPVCLLYFKQFPNYFLITNLIVVPLSTIILFAEIILVAFTWCPGIDYWATMTQWLIHGMNQFIEFCSRMPYALTAPVYATVYSTWMMGAVMASIAWGVLRRQKKAIGLAAIFAMLFSAGYLFETFNRIHQRKILVYNTPGRTTMDILYNNRFVCIGDSVETQTSSAYEYLVLPARIHYRASKRVNTLPGIMLQPEAMSLAGKRWIRLNGKNARLNMDMPVSADVLLVSRQAPVPDEEMLATLRPQQVVLDATNSLWKIEEWKKACEKLLLPCHSVTQNGTFSANW
ncbi:MAG TPA: ComEC/Rec2 family competence protein [Ferruginibacter sp.]|nr:ComEC/Rec2 family competence protein [Ferruginibacter sp.]HRO16929.1 ComEC/Rec2 family competence protein [Ferruginibacter sp.]HRQ20608.1 ComEC/Rec2 family competence protein [Ferruginibacter sp.]